MEPMTESRINLQKDYFDIESHQYAASKIISLDTSHQLEIDHIENLLKLKPPKNIIDFGSGNGRIAIPFLKKGFNIHAVDISKKSLQALELIYKKNKTPHWGKLTSSTVLPENKKFDGLIGSDILHHVDINDVLPHIRKVLKLNAPLVISEPNAWHILWYLYILKKLDWQVEKGILQCSIPYIETSLRKNNFQNIGIEGHGFFPTPIFNFSHFFVRLNVLSLGNLPLVKFFAFRLIISAKKT